MVKEHIKDDIDKQETTLPAEDTSSQGRIGGAETGKQWLWRDEAERARRRA